MAERLFSKGGQEGRRKLDRRSKALLGLVPNCLATFTSATKAKAEHVNETKDKHETKRHGQPRLDRI